MKSSYKKMFIFDISLLLVLLINSFIKNFLSNYFMILFLVISLIIFNLIFVFEKNRYRYIKDMIIQMTINLLIFFLIYYLFGLIVGFYKIDNYFTIKGFTNFIIPTILIILLKEYLRYQMLIKNNNKLLLDILLLIIFIFIDISNAIYFTNLSSIQSIFILFAINILPSISSNIFLNYLSINTSFIISSYYLLVINLYQYFIPIIPNPSKYLISLINLLLPIILLIIMRRIIIKEKDLDVVSRSDNSISSFLFIFTCLFILILVYFNSGYFSHMSIAVASESMYPVIKKGDVVLIKKKKDNEDFSVNNIIAYKYSDVIIVHRIKQREVKNNSYYYYTKGDANSLVDDWVVDYDMIMGKVVFKIPYLGIPTIWLRDT